LPAPTGRAWRVELQLEQVLRVDAEGRVQVSRALHARLDYLGGQPPSLEVLP
jgi:hypothetical protein